MPIIQIKGYFVQKLSSTYADTTSLLLCMYTANRKKNIHVDKARIAVPIHGGLYVV